VCPDVLAFCPAHFRGGADRRRRAARAAELVTIRDHREILARVRNADAAEAVARLESHLMQTKKGFKAALR
jgi:DNA-binding GntR family transcriptional regulator